MSRLRPLLYLLSVVPVLFLLGCALLPAEFVLVEQRPIPAPPALVFRTLHAPRSIEAWAHARAYGEAYLNASPPAGLWRLWWFGDPGWTTVRPVELTPPERASYRHQSELLGPTTVTWTFEANGEGTLVSARYEGAPPGWFGGWIAVLAPGWLARSVRDALAELEAQSTASVNEEPVFEPYTYVLLRKGPAWSDEDTDANRALMKGHLDHFSSLYDRGLLHLCGPFSHQPDADVRGMCLYKVDLDRAKELAAEDPRVIAGQLRVEVMTLWTKKDALFFAP
jgi:uncharacterized protein YndB with AHSA1/START domain